jgi:hypothetical protein
MVFVVCLLRFSGALRRKYDTYGQLLYLSYNFVSMIVTELYAPDGRRLAGGLSRSDSSISTAPRSALSLGALIDHPVDAVAILEEGLAGAFDRSLETLWQEAPPGESTFIVLVPRREAPRIDPYYGDPVSSFLCSPAVFAAFLALRRECSSENICFTVLHAIANGEIAVDRLLVRQLPDTTHRARREHVTPKALIMPHRGDPGYLRTALNYLSRIAGNSLKVRVGLDVEDASPYGDLAKEFPAMEFFHASPSPVGPYVIRQELAERSTEPLLSLQDSDDLSCYDRFTALSEALDETGCDMAGSQELCLDEIRSVIHPVWYPTDPSDGLAIRANHALLHATMMTRRQAFFESGGLSTHHVFANDTQFILRAFFSMKIRNVDEMLYIRRRHATSLTNAPDTNFANPLRLTLDREWSRDFEAIKRGEMKLENSSLRPMRRERPYRLERLARPR